jgi:hypothetical protein
MNVHASDGTAYEKSRAMNTNPAIKERRCLVQSLAQPMHPTTKSVIYYWR